MNQKKTENMAAVLSTIEGFASEVESKFTSLLDSLNDLRGDLGQITQLKELVSATESMLEGDVSQNIESEEAKGEVGRLFNAINKTLQKLQQLDQGVQAESDKVPELASHLDQRTQETETATQQVLEKLDSMLETSDHQASNLENLKKAYDNRLIQDREFATKINQFFVDLENTNDRDQMVQEAACVFRCESLGAALDTAAAWRIRWKRTAPSAVEQFVHGIRNSLMFYELPKRWWKRVHTNNHMERQIRTLRQRLRLMGCFHDESAVERAVFGQLLRWHKIKLTHNT